MFTGLRSGCCGNRRTRRNLQAWLRPARSRKPRRRTRTWCVGVPKDGLIARPSSSLRICARQCAHPAWRSTSKPAIARTKSYPRRTPGLSPVYGYHIQRARASSLVDESACLRQRSISNCARGEADGGYRPLHAARDPGMLPGRNEDPLRGRACKLPLSPSEAMRRPERINLPGKTGFGDHSRDRLYQMDSLDLRCEPRRYRDLAAHCGPPENRGRVANSLSRMG